MFRALAFGCGVGIGLAWWSSRPPIPLSQGYAFAVLTAVLVVVAFLAGKSQRGDPMDVAAIASSRAEASADARAVQQVVIQAGQGPSGATDLVALDRAEWRGERRLELDEAIDGYDLTAMLDDAEGATDEPPPSGQAPSGARPLARGDTGETDTG